MLSSGYTPTILLRRLIHRDVNISLPKFKMQFGTEMSHVFRKVFLIEVDEMSTNFRCVRNLVQPSFKYCRWASVIYLHTKRIFLV